MVNIRRTHRRIGTQSSGRSSRCTRKSVVLQSSLRSDRQLRSSTIPSRPSLPPSNHEGTRLLLKTLNAHQAATKRTINPEDDIKNFRRLAVSHYILKLLEDAEFTLPLPPSRTLTLEQRVKRIQGHCHMVECPQFERPDLIASRVLIQLQHSETLSADYENWRLDKPLDEPPLHALFFASRAFGGLCCKLPPNISHEDPCLPLLISLCDWHDRHLKDTMKIHYEQDMKNLFRTYASIPSERPDQASTPRHNPCPPQLAEPNSDSRQMYRIGCSNVPFMTVEARPWGDNWTRSPCRLQDVLNGICCEVNGRRVIGFDTYKQIFVGAVSLYVRQVLASYNISFSEFDEMGMNGGTENNGLKTLMPHNRVAVHRHCD